MFAVLIARFKRPDPATVGVVGETLNMLDKRIERHSQRIRTLESQIAYLDEQLRQERESYEALKDTSSHLLLNNTLGRAAKDLYELPLVPQASPETDAQIARMAC